MFRTFAISLVLSVVAAISSYCREQTGGQLITGPFRVVDGDTLTFGGGRLRLEGIDAPESQQRCGEGVSRWSCGLSATAGLRALVTPGTVCEGSRRDRYRRLLVRCTAAGRDINAEMVRQGLAVSYGDYQAEEDQAKAARRGVWAGPFQRPADWRKARRLETDTTTFRDWIRGLWQ